VAGAPSTRLLHSRGSRAPTRFTRNSAIVTASSRRRYAGWSRIGPDSITRVAAATRAIPPCSHRFTDSVGAVSNSSRARLRPATAVGAHNGRPPRARATVPASSRAGNASSRTAPSARSTAFSHGYAEPYQGDGTADANNVGSFHWPGGKPAAGSSASSLGGATGATGAVLGDAVGSGVAVALGDGAALGEVDVSGVTVTGPALAYRTEIATLPGLTLPAASC